MADLIGTDEAWGVVREKLNKEARNRVSLARFGVVFDTLVDQSAKIQSALDSGEALWFPPHDLFIGDGLVLPSGTSIQGTNPTRSRFRALPGATDDMVSIPSGQVRFLTLRDFSLIGDPQNADHNGMILAARPDAGGNGGIWEGIFENLGIRGFDGVSMAWLGWESLGVAPHQFISLRMIDVERPLITSDLALYMHGQCEHFHFDSCRFDGNGSGTASYGGQNVYIGRSFAGSAGHLGPYGTGAPLSDVAPRVVKFTNLTCQAADQALIVDRAENVDFDTPWFESNHNTLLAQSSARVSVRNARFANAATAPISGRAVRSNSLAEIVMEGRAFFTGTNTIAYSTDGSGSIKPAGAQGTVSLENVEPTRTISAPSVTRLETGVAPGVNLTVNASGVTLTELSSSIASGELFSLRVMSGQPITLSNAGGSATGFNLGNGVANLTVNVGDTVLLRKSQVSGTGGKGWNLVSKI